MTITSKKNYWDVRAERDLQFHCTLHTLHDVPL
jgi:hypothetical protein